ncbi:phage head-tail connector protein [Dethiothermospora halolimnae]|uniref:phage head-tail connector protein n=1 Tax=Dethiothermospora halolimnae TaxID=3114390 RepID=UPI003CCBBD83
MDNLILMKELLGIDTEDTSKDSILNHFLNKARNIILTYCNVDELSSDYDGVVVDFAVYLYKNKNNTGVMKKIEGERSVTFEIGLPENIRLALPLPKIKVGGY